MSRAGAVQSAPGLSSLPAQLDLYLPTVCWARALIIGRTLNLGALRAQRAGADVSTLPRSPSPHPNPVLLTACYNVFLFG